MTTNTDDNTNTPPATAEDAAFDEGMAALRAEVAGDAADRAPGQADQAAPVAANVADEARAVMALGLSLGLPMLRAWKGDRYADRFGPDEQRNIGDTFAQLAVSQGWQVGEAFGRWAPWIAFAGAVIGPVLPPLMEDMAAAKAAEKPAEVPHQAPAPEASAPQVAEDGRVL